MFPSSCYAAVTLYFHQELNLSRGMNVGPKMVAKESRHVGAENLKMSFHDSFAMTQLTAQRIATRFNRRVRQALSVVCPPDGNSRVWDISFLPCSVYTFLDGGVERGVLVEKKLEGRYTKFNGNNGYVNDASVATAAAAAGATQAVGSHDGKTRGEGMMEVIEEGDEEESDGESASCLSDGNDDVEERAEATKAVADPSDENGDTVDSASSVSCFNPEPEGYVQAFSHFSYRTTHRKMLVCDLQGVQSTSAAGEDRAGVFELTDPVIHYRSKSRNQVYGKTDLGKKGVQRFFQTHQCNEVCRLLGLSG